MRIDAILPYAPDEIRGFFPGPVIMNNDTAPFCRERFADSPPDSDGAAGNKRNL
jgi:hypothetical protein